jgi:hypothetical protein
VVRVEKEYPSANLIPGWSRQIMLPNCSVRVVVVVKAPSTLFDGDGTSIPPIDINVVEVIICDAAGYILPYGGRKSVSGWTVNHGMPNVKLRGARSASRLNDRLGL